MVKDRRLYDVLGVEPSATSSQLKKAWHQAARKHHPDKPGGDDEKFKECEAAYKVLIDAELRAHYDRTGHVDKKRAEIDDLDSLFGGLFAGGLFGFPNSFNGGHRQTKCAPVTVELKITLKEAFTGKTTKLAISRRRPCKSCDGNGGTDPTVCKRCNGNGIIVTQQFTSGVMFHNQTACPDCKMGGKVYNTPCKVCKQECFIVEKAHLALCMPPGVQDGQTFHFQEQGDQLPNTIPSDVIVVIRIAPHEVFTRKGDNLCANLTIDLCTALIGGKTSIQGLDENVLNINIPKGKVIHPGYELTVSKEGMPTKNGGRGELELTFQVSFPDDEWASKVDEAAIRRIFSHPSDKHENRLFV